MCVRGAVPFSNGIARLFRETRAAAAAPASRLKLSLGRGFFPPRFVRIRRGEKIRCARRKTGLTELTVKAAGTRACLPLSLSLRVF